MSRRRRVQPDGFFALRWKILLRDHFTCQYCGQKAPSVPMEIDHRTPVADGGSYDEDNLVAACWACNRGKNALNLMLNKRARQIDKKHRCIIHPLIPDRPTVAGQLRDILKSNNDGLTVAELAELLGTTKTAARVMLQRLRIQGMAEAYGSDGLRKRWRLVVGE